MKILISPIIGVLILMSATGNIFEGTDRRESNILGKWVRIGPQGPMVMTLKKDGTVEGDFGNDGSIDVLSQYELVGDEISFSDESGAMCHEKGRYKILRNDYYIAFDLVDDNCGGRIKSTMGFWTRPEFKDFISELNTKLSDGQEPELLLARARIYLAVGNAPKAQTDLDKYIEQIDTNPRAYLNRAATNMPGNLMAVMEDCTRTIELEANNKNAYFLRGLARYELGEKEAGCEDFKKAIELGFSVLRIAEQEKCDAFWSEDK